MFYLSPIIIRRHLRGMQQPGLDQQQQTQHQAGQMIMQPNRNIVDQQGQFPQVRQQQVQQQHQIAEPHGSPMCTSIPKVVVSAGGCQGPVSGPRGMPQQ